jgi:hypothetical protein
MFRENLRNHFTLQLPIFLFRRASRRDVTAIFSRERGDPLDCIIELEDLELDLRIADELAVVGCA